MFTLYFLAYPLAYVRTTGPWLDFFGTEISRAMICISVSYYHKLTDITTITPMQGAK